MTRKNFPCIGAAAKKHPHGMSLHLHGPARVFHKRKKKMTLTLDEVSYGPTHVLRLQVSNFFLMHSREGYYAGNFLIKDHTYMGDEFTPVLFYVDSRYGNY